MIPAHRRDSGKGIAVSRPSLRTCVSTAALCGTLGASIALPFTALAEEGGMLMQLKLGQRLLGREVSSPDPALEESSVQAITDIAFSLSSETRTQALKLDLNAGYRFVDSDDGAGFVGGASDPSLKLTYSEVAASASFNVTATASRSNLRYANPLDTGRGPDGSLSPDFADLTGDGTRTALGFAAQMSLRDDAPFGMTLSLGLDEVTYDDTTNPALNDSTRIRLGLENRFDISEVMRATLGLHYSLTDIDGSATRDRYGIDAGLVITRPNGTIGLTLTGADGTDGQQTGAQITRSYNLERTQVQIGLGATQATTGKTYVTGLASLNHSFADDSAFGPIKINARREMGLGSADQEQMVSSLTASTSYAVSPQVTLSARAGFAQTEDVASGSVTDIANAGLNVAYALTPDWAVTGGVSGQLRDPDGGARATSTTLSLGLTRSFDVRR